MVPISLLSVLSDRPRKEHLSRDQRDSRAEQEGSEVRMSGLASQSAQHNDCAVQLPSSLASMGLDFLTLKMECYRDFLLGFLHELGE